MDNEQTPTNTPSTTDTPSPSNSPSNFAPALTSNEIKGAAEFIRQHWTGSPEVLETTLNRIGAFKTEDKRNEAEKSFDKSFGVPADQNYHLNFVNRGIGDPVALAKTNREFNQAFAAMQLPQTVGQGLMEAMLNSSARYDKMNEVEKKIYQQHQAVVLENLGKDIGNKEKISELAATALRSVDKKMVTEFLNKGMFESGEVMIQLARQGQRIAHRAKLSRPE